MNKLNFTFVTDRANIVHRIYFRVPVPVQPYRATTAEPMVSASGLPFLLNSPLLRQ